MRYFILLIAVLFSSCYSERKARSQFGKAAAAYPLVPAQFCAITYPPKDSLIKGDTVLSFDTIYTGGTTIFDTTIVNDTVRIVKTIQLAGVRIIEKYFIHDTLQVVNTAALKACELVKDQAVFHLTEMTAASNAWEKKAKKRFWILFGIGLVGVAFIANKVYRTITKPKI